MNALALPVGFRVLQPANNRLLIKIAMAFLFAVLTAIAAQVRIPLPFTPVPITLQTLFVLASGMLLGPMFGLLSMAIYITMGAIGLPAFSDGASGLSALAGVTGGYILGFAVFSYVSGEVYYRKGFADRKPFVQYCEIFALSILAIFVPGVIGLKMFSPIDISWLVAVEKGLIPFIPGDIVKIALVYGAIKCLDTRFPADEVGSGSC